MTSIRPFLSHPNVPPISFLSFFPLHSLSLAINRTFIRQLPDQLTLLRLCIVLEISKEIQGRLRHIMHSLDTVSQACLLFFSHLDSTVEWHAPRCTKLSQAEDCCAHYPAASILARFLEFFFLFCVIGCRELEGTASETLACLWGCRHLWLYISCLISFGGTWVGYQMVLGSWVATI